VLVKAGLERIRLHDLRHPAASLSLLAGTSAKVVSDKLGHISPAFTMRIYQHVVCHAPAQGCEGDRLFAPKRSKK
jgi:integrase